MMLKVKNSFDKDYSSEALVIGEERIHKLLDGGRAWDLGPTLERGGSAIFPHTYLNQCGDQIAAVVHALLDSGADQVLVLGAVHTRGNSLLQQVRREELRREPLSDLTYSGVLQEPLGEYSLLHFKTLWDAEVKRRGIRSPHLLLRYPCLVNGYPESLLGIEELKQISRDAPVVLTADMVHHGVAYTTERQMDRGPYTEIFVQEAIHELFALLNQENYDQFIQTSVYYRNDARDALSVLRYLKGPMDPTLFSLRLVDTSDLFENNPSPSWCSAHLIALEKKPF